MPPVTTYAYNPDGTLERNGPDGKRHHVRLRCRRERDERGLPAPATGEYNPPESGESGPDYSPTISYAYDLAGNLLTTTAPSPTGTGTVTTVNTYDQQNNLLTSEDPDGNAPSPSMTNWAIRSR